MSDRETVLRRAADAVDQAVTAISQYGVVAAGDHVDAAAGLRALQDADQAGISQDEIRAARRT